MIQYLNFVQQCLMYSKYRLRVHDRVRTPDGVSHDVTDPNDWEGLEYELLSDWRSIPCDDDAEIDLGEYPSIRIRLTDPDGDMILTSSADDIAGIRLLPKEMTSLVSNSCRSGKVWRWVGLLRATTPRDHLFMNSILSFEDTCYAC
jgi:hypothetical protein